MKTDFNHSVTIMGILNLTPDSFYDGGVWNNKKKIISIVQKWNDLGIRMIDVGCESSRPGADPIDIDEEIKRLNLIIPIIKLFPEIIFSIDTYKPEVARYAIENGFNIINDIFGGSENKMFEIAKEYDVPLIIMHMKGSPKTMQKNIKNKNIVEEVIEFFNERVHSAKNFGIKSNNIILDPGIGFGKSFSDNDKILFNIKRFKNLGFPILIGTSRKSFLKANDSPKGRLANSIASMTLSIINGANIIRVHDVKESLKVKYFLTRYIKSNFPNA